MGKRSAAIIGFFLVFGLTAAQGQNMTLAEVQGGGASVLSADEVKALVDGAKTEFTLVNGTTRIWTNASDGTFIASRDAKVSSGRKSGRGTWSINDQGAYCVTFDWGGLDKEEWCRRLYRVSDRYYAFGKNAKPETQSGTYHFSR